MSTDAGRCMRPLFVVDNNMLRLTKDEVYSMQDWKDLLMGK